MSRILPAGGQMPAELMAQGPVPVLLVNPPFPALDPFIAILTAQFLQRKVWLEWFVFTAVWNTLLANAAGQLPTVPMTIDPNIDYLVMQMNLTAFSDVNTIIANPNYLMEVTETSGRMNWQDAPMHVGNVTGANRNTGAQTYDLPVPRYIRGNNNVSMKLTNLTAVAARVDLAIMGYRVTYTGIRREELFPIPS